MAELLIHVGPGALPHGAVVDVRADRHQHSAWELRNPNWRILAVSGAVREFVRLMEDEPQTGKRVFRLRLDRGSAVLRRFIAAEHRQFPKLHVLRGHFEAMVEQMPNPEMEAGHAAWHAMLAELRSDAP